MVTLTNACVASGFALFGVVSQGSLGRAPSVADAARVFAMYGAVRCFALTAAVVWCIRRRSAPALALLAAVLALVQGGDALVGVVAHDVGKTVGPLVLAVATAAACVRLRASPEPR